MHAVEIVTTGPADVMPGIARTLVEERWVACAHLAPIDSVYAWRGTIESAAEVRVALHTRAEHFDAVGDRIAALHPYELPAIFALPLERTTPGYLAWIVGETRD